MSTLAQFAGNAPTTSIVNAFSTNGAAVQIGVQGSGSTNSATNVLSGALTANTLASALSVTGGGEVPYLSVFTKAATSRTVRIKVTVDGVSVFDSTSTATAVTNSGLLVVGQTSATNFVVQAPAPLRFNSSLLVEIASSLSETDKVSIAYVLNKR